MKRSVVPIILALATLALAQQPPPPSPDVFVKGDMSIQFLSRGNVDSSGKQIRENVTDKYTLAINVSNSVQYHGNIVYTPYLGKIVGASQDAKLDYSIECDVVNPKNPAQKRNVGRLYGTVPVDKNNVYRYDDGNLKQVVFPMGTAKGFEGTYKGLALGKPPASAEGFFSKLKKEALNITKSVGGKTVAISVTKYDKMEFRQCLLASGPVQVYPEVLVSGAMIYDYGRTAWYFDNVSAGYNLDGRQYQDKLSGNIRWVESPNRSANGEGEYQFDIRINEPAQTESAIFSGPADEAAFFATDDALTSLTGLMKYKDTMNGDSVSASVVTVDLKGNKLTKQQAMYLTKLLFITCVVPLNAE